MITETLTGQANKAVMAGVLTAVGAKYVQDIVQWLVAKGSTALETCCSLGMPDNVQIAVTMVVMGLYGYLGTYAVPNKPAD